MRPVLPILVAIPLLAALAMPAAASEVTRVKSIKTNGVASIVLEAGVGQVRIEPGSGAEIDARVTIRAKRNTGIFSSLPDVQKLDISATTRGDQLTLKVDSKNIEEEWLVRVPKMTLSSLELKLGVGDARVGIPAKRVEVDVGVGDVNLDVPSGAIRVQLGTGNASVRTSIANAGKIDGKTGVGSVSLKGLEGTVKGSTVGGSVTGTGRGEQPLEGRVGVGDLDIVLTE
jgi:hypothetical protein